MSITRIPMERTELSHDSAGSSCRQCQYPTDWNTVRSGTGTNIEIRYLVTVCAVCRTVLYKTPVEITTCAQVHAAWSAREIVRFIRSPHRSSWLGRHSVRRRKKAGRPMKRRPDRMLMSTDTAPGRTWTRSQKRRDGGLGLLHLAIGVPHGCKELDARSCVSRVACRVGVLWGISQHAAFSGVDQTGCPVEGIEVRIVWKVIYLV